jgi:hypothetical protein
MRRALPIRLEGEISEVPDMSKPRALISAIPLLPR